MEKFTQKWAIVSLLEDVEEGSEFYFTDFPLHVTLAGVFSTPADKDQLVHGLAGLLRKQSLIEIEADEADFFGPNEDIPVMRIKQSGELKKLHLQIHDWLTSLHVEYNSPQYQGSGYHPHCTVQRDTSLSLGEQRVLTSVSLIDLFPNNDGYQRKIVKTIQLG